MPHKKADDPVQYRITYYGTGMSPMYKYFYNRMEAEREFKEMCDDPYAGAGLLEEIRALLRKVYK